MNAEGEPVNSAAEIKSRIDVQAIIKGTSASGEARRRRILVIAVLFAGVLLAWIAWSISSGTAAVRYLTEPVVRGGLIVTVTATGSVQPTKKVDVSSELSGTVRKVLVDYNSAVTAGQPLAELDTDKLKATVDSSRAKLAAAKARVMDAEATVVEKSKDFERRTKLAPSGAVSRQDVDQAQAAHDRAEAAVLVARAEVGVAEAELHLNETNLGKACICSPINGVVLKRNVDPGQTVASSLQAPILFSIAEDLKQMELQIDVDEADVGKVKVGQTAAFSVDAFPDRRFPATIRDVRFASETIQGVVTYKAVLNIDNSELLLRPGMTATADIRVTEIKDALLVPNAGLRYAPPTTQTTTNRSLLSRLMPRPSQVSTASPRVATGSDRTVWVLRDGQPAQVKVVVGASDGKRTEVRDGELTASQTVIVDQTTSKP